MPASLLTPEVITIPAGAFVMGAGEDDKFASVLELPRRAVTFERAFALGKYPVTFAEWDTFASEVAGVFSPPDYGMGRGSLAVSSVSWEDARGYLAWLAETTGKPFRLPSDAEWEYACRAGSAGLFSTGCGLPVEAANYWYSETGEQIGPGKPLPVGSYPPNAFGLHDMHGTVCEIVADTWHDGYDGLPTDGSAHHDPKVPRVVRRGGAWDYAARLLRSAYRDWIGRTQRLDNVGFRVACDLVD